MSRRIRVSYLVDVDLETEDAIVNHYGLPSNNSKEHLKRRVLDGWIRKFCETNGKGALGDCITDLRNSAP